MHLRNTAICLILALTVACTPSSPILENDWSKLGPGPRLVDGTPTAKLTPHIKDGILSDARYPDQNSPVIIENDSMAIPFYFAELDTTAYINHKHRVISVGDLIVLELTVRNTQAYSWCESPSASLKKMSEPFGGPINVNGYKLGEKIDTTKFVRVGDLFANRWEKGEFYSPRHDPSLVLETTGGIIHTIEKLVFTDRSYTQWAEVITHNMGMAPELANLDGTEATNYHKWLKGGLFVGLSLTNNEEPISKARTLLDKGNDVARESYLKLLSDFQPKSYKLTYSSSGLRGILTWWKVLDDTGTR